MTSGNEPSLQGIERRFRDLSVDVREERLIRYIVHQVQTGRHIADIINDPYVTAHFDEEARARIIEHPDVIRSIEEQIRRQFAGYSFAAPAGPAEAAGAGGDQDQDSTGRTSHGEVPDL